MQGKLSRNELRARMSAIRADINRRINAADIGLSAAPADIAERRAKVMQCTPEAFRFFCKTYLPHYFPDDSFPYMGIHGTARNRKRAGICLAVLCGIARRSKNIVDRTGVCLVARSA